MKDKFNRREFLTRVSVAAGAATIMGIGAGLIHNRSKAHSTTRLEIVRKDFINT